MIRIGHILRLGFIVLFGAMSLLHGPVMGYAAHGDHALHHAADGEASDHARHDAPPAQDRAASCGGFACFIAVEAPAPARAPLHAILIGALSIAPQSVLHDAGRIPDTPPPRIQS